ncbi:MAG: NTP transferase domain-containing protein [Muribaculaceae bacterium]|nr:NTP transferase domain-containing protein [Muribaculaceae bacterium]
MKAFIPAAGLGTRLRPFTLSHPKALVPVDGVPILERVIVRLKNQGFDDFVINLHHFGDQIRDFVKSKDNFGVKIRFSDESGQLLETGGALLHAAGMLGATEEPFLIHNVDILSNADLRGLMKTHEDEKAAATLLVSDRESSRRLLFDNSMNLRGWHNVAKDLFRPESERKEIVKGLQEGVLYEKAFSGIHVMSPGAIFEEMCRQKKEGVFSVIDFYLDAISSIEIKGCVAANLRMIDIGKPETLAKVAEYSDLL